MSTAPSDPANPYAPPRSAVGGAASDLAIETRRAQLLREAVLRGLGAGYAFVCAPVVALLALLMVIVSNQGSDSDDTIVTVVVSLVGIGGTWITAALGRRLMRLEAPRIVEFVVMLGFSLLALPLGPVLVGGTWLLAATGKGRHILSEEGAALRERTAGLGAPRSRQLVVVGLVALLMLFVQPILLLILAIVA